jgi:hypothetical protein
MRSLADIFAAVPHEWKDEIQAGPNERDCMTGSDIPTEDANAVAGLADAMSAMVDLLFSADTVEQTLDSVMELATTTIEGCDFAGIILLNEGIATIRACTLPDVLELEALKNPPSDSLFLESIRNEWIYYNEDLIESAQVEWVAEARERNIRSLLGLPFVIAGTPGTLALFARYPSAFGVMDRGRGILLAHRAGAAITAAQEHETEMRVASNLNSALVTREIIGEAKGILMERERITSDQAFDVLRRASQHLNLKLRDIAQSLVDTGERPDTG